MLKEILLPVDLQESALSQRALSVAQDIAKQYGAHVTVITVIPDFGMPVVANYFPADALEKAKREVDEELKRFIDTHFDDTSNVRRKVAQGSPHKIVVSYALEHEIDLIVVPARAKDISKVFLGSSSTHIVERAPCSVLVVRP